MHTQAWPNILGGLISSCDQRHTAGFRHLFLLNDGIIEDSMQVLNDSHLNYGWTVTNPVCILKSEINTVNKVNSESLSDPLISGTI